MQIFGKPWKETLLDQGSHALWGFATGAALGAGGLWAIAGGLSVLAFVVREIVQWPPNEARPYDPFVDAGFYALGLAGGVALIAYLL